MSNVTFVHAGIVATALDSACGYAAFSLMPANAGVLTVEFKTSLLVAGPGAAVSLPGAGREAREDVDLLRARAFAEDDTAEPRLVVSMAATLMAIYDRPGITH